MRHTEPRHILMVVEKAPKITTEVLIFRCYGEFILVSLERRNSIMSASTPLISKGSKNLALSRRFKESKTRGLLVTDIIRPRRVSHQRVMPLALDVKRR